MPRARSLRLKLTLWYLLVFSILQATLLGAVVLFRREGIRRSLDDDLASSAEAMVDNVLAADVPWTTENTTALVPAGTGFLMYCIRDDEGRPIVSWNVPEESELPFSAWEVVPSGPVGAVFTTIPSDRATELTAEEQRLRLITIPFRTDGELYYFQAAVADRVIARLLGPFFDLVVIGIPVGLVAALLAAWVIAGRAVSPIHRLLRAARRVSPTSLGEPIRVASTDEEISRLEEELNSALARLEAGYRAQEQFISNVSHELKTPIAVLLTEAQVFDLGEPSIERANAFAERVEQEMKRLGRLVESFLILTRAEMAKDLPGRFVPVHDVVLQAVKRCRVLAEERGVHLVPNLVSTDDQAPEVRGDADLLQAMVENLLRNAIHHSPAGAVVAIDAESSPGERVVVSVRDRGPGIPPEYVERIFERFVRGPRRREGSDGMGLGLAIARNVARLHDGTIEAANHPDGGCTFRVTLPLPGGGER